MKKILAILLAGGLFLMQSCQPENMDGGENDGGKGDNSGILANAICEMDIQSLNKTKGLDVVGDSQAVHQLAVYACAIVGARDSSWINGYMDFCQYNFFGTDTDIFIRDTINHVFSFQNDAVIGFEKFDYPEGKPIGVVGTEYLGWMICYIEPVFCAWYDTVNECYLNPSDDDILFFDCRLDTLGYIPKEMMSRNRERLLQLLSEQRFQEMIDIYKTGYHIYTCSGEEYDEIVRKREE